MEPRLRHTAVDAFADEDALELDRRFRLVGLEQKLHKCIDLDAVHYLLVLEVGYTAGAEVVAAERGESAGDGVRQHKHAREALGWLAANPS